MTVNHACMARQYSDQKRCERCNLTWDMNDPDPPHCKTEKQIITERYIEPLKQKLKEREES